MKKIPLIFYLEEEVTPELFACKVALACSKEGAIRENEQVGTLSDSVRFKSVEQSIRPI